jgi:hypothetical protein
MITMASAAPRSITSNGSIVIATYLGDDAPADHLISLLEESYAGYHAAT